MDAAAGLSNKFLLGSTIILTVTTAVGYGFVAPAEILFDPAGLIQSAFMAVLCIAGFSLIQLYKADVGWTLIPHNLLTVSLGMILYYPWCLLIMRSSNPLSKTAGKLPGSIATSPNSYDYTGSEFSEGQTVVSMFRFCLMLIISQSGFKQLSLIGSLLLTIVACPIYLLNTLIMIWCKYSDPGGTIQIFAFAGAFGFGADLMVRYYHSDKLTLEYSKPRGLTSIEKLLIMLGALLSWALLPFAIETRVVSIDPAITNQRSSNPAALLHQQNVYTALMYCLLGILLREASEEKRPLRIQTVVYSLLCSTITVSSANQYIKSTAFLAIVSICAGYLFDTLFIYTINWETEPTQHQPPYSSCPSKDVFRERLANAAARSFYNGCLPVLGFGIAGAAGFLILMIMAGLSMAPWMSPYWNSASPFDSPRTLANTPAVLIGVWFVTTVLAFLFGILSGFLLSLLVRRVQVLAPASPYCTFDQQTRKMAKEQRDQFDFRN